MKLLQLPCTALLLSFSAGLACASATSADYAVCHRKAAQTLQMCLDRGGSPECWAEARRVNERCYTSVREGYSVDKKKVEAMRRAEAKAAAERDKSRDSTR
ncbi:MAG: hypothetical protein ACT6Q9_03425 [Polaromonas sp.]|uniref:hypothetical protein n=1 Tax=Polaromonas sp. TaxID=1869339 RepID=UPI00403705C0